MTFVLKAAQVVERSALQHVTHSVHVPTSTPHVIPGLDIPVSVVEHVGKEAIGRNEADQISTISNVFQFVDQFEEDPKRISNLARAAIGTIVPSITVSPSTAQETSTSNTFLSDHFDLQRDIEKNITTTTTSTLIPHSHGSTLFEETKMETTYNQDDVSLISTVKETLLADVSKEDKQIADEVAQRANNHLQLTASLTDFIVQKNISSSSVGHEHLEDIIEKVSLMSDAIEAGDTKQIVHIAEETSQIPAEGFLPMTTLLTPESVVLAPEISI